MQVNIVCKDAWQKITVDEWDVDPNDMKMTVKCLPTFKYDLPSENFPKVNENPPILNIVYIPIPPQKMVEHFANYIFPSVGVTAQHLVGYGTAPLWMAP